MKFYKKIPTLAFLVTASLAGCASDAADCFETGCEFSPDTVDSIDPTGIDVSRFRIEIVGEGQVVVDGEPCTTEHGICESYASPGAVIVLDGDFFFTNETGEREQAGRCFRERGCRLVLGHDDVRVIADVDVDGDRGYEVERRPFGLLPEQPGQIVDNFHNPLSQVENHASQGDSIISQ